MDILKHNFLTCAKAEKNDLTICIVEMEKNFKVTP